jgi:aspartate/methionine/tyrosine aminotransferase
MMNDDCGIAFLLYAVFYYFAGLAHGKYSIWTDDYIRDIVHPARAVPVHAPVPAEVDSLSPDVIPYIRKTIREKQDEGVKVKAMILNNPHNPLARCYPVETILEYAALAAEVC